MVAVLQIRNNSKDVQHTIDSHWWRSNDIRCENEEIQRRIQTNYDSEGSKTNTCQIVIDFLHNSNIICMIGLRY